ncbi:protein p13 mtcp-1 [Limosa lapponica baueri]|uniref:Protein p13 mtcp-1 n=1 Tax=Limosa lapponica baueri TaxID=1758121 RepID=A0A2I0TU44_LIMLA|nr:protein p13 mtcp-1 [Limosa lapponica baueri]
MAEGGHAGAPPVRLWVRRVGVYCDEHRKTWLVAAEEASEEGMLRARIQRVQVPLGEALRPSQLPPSRLPHMWQLSQGEQYRDSNSRVWEIEHHLMLGGVEELLLKLVPVNNYVESKCESVLREMRKCCARYPKGRSVCCSGFEKEEREREKLKATSEGIPPSPQ